MSIILDKRELNAALKKIKLVVPSKATIQILENVFIKATDDGTALLRGTDLDLDLEITIQANGKGQDEVCLNAALFEDLTRPEGSEDQGLVELQSNSEDSVTAKIDDLETTLNTSHAKDYPVREKVIGKSATKYKVEEVLNELIFVLPAVSRDPARPHINNVLFIGSDVVSTDGHRLHKGSLPRKVKKDFLLTYEAASALAKLLAAESNESDVEFSLSKDRVIVSSGDWVLSCKKVDAKLFPPHDRVTPATSEFTVEVESDKALKVFKRAQKLAGGKADGGLQFVCGSKIVVETFNFDRGSSSTELECLDNTLAKRGAYVPLRVELLAQYVIEGMKVGETARFGFNGDMDPVVIRGKRGRLAVVMPRRI